LATWVSLQDRPGGLVELTTACGDSGVNILALDVLPALDGQVTDELVLHTPATWTGDDVRAMCRDADILEVGLKQCSVHAMGDTPVRYLRAVRRIAAALKSLPPRQAPPPWPEVPHAPPHPDDRAGHVGGSRREQPADRIRDLARLGDAARRHPGRPLATHR
jgi:hypothetical protein